VAAGWSARDLPAFRADGEPSVVGARAGSFRDGTEGRAGSVRYGRTNGTRCAQNAALRGGRGTCLPTAAACAGELRLESFSATGGQAKGFSGFLFGVWGCISGERSGSRTPLSHFFCSPLPSLPLPMTAQNAEPARRTRVASSTARLLRQKTSALRSDAR